MSDDYITPSAPVAMSSVKLTPEQLQDAIDNGGIVKDETGGVIGVLQAVRADALPLEALPEFTVIKIGDTVYMNAGDMWRDVYSYDGWATSAELAELGTYEVLAMGGVQEVAL